jgi:membrane-associated phospholipid phosphatase
VNLTLTPERISIAQFWADGGGTFTPPGHWNEIAVDKAVTAGFNECRMARMLAALGAAQHDAFVACWDCKYFYDVERPVTVIRRDVGGAYAAWLPLITTPPFPSYPSGHSSTSGAASQVLGYFFPEDSTELAVMANEAKDSRLYGGIHFTFDNDTGLSLGRSIGTLAIVHLEEDGAP